MPQKIKMNQKDTMTFEEGFDQFLLDCKARDLRENNQSLFDADKTNLEVHPKRNTHMSDFSDKTLVKCIIY